MERLQSELFRKVQKYWKYWNGSRKGRERAGNGREWNFCPEKH